MSYIGKQPAVAALTASDITDGIIANADISSSAAIATSKLGAGAILQVVSTAKTDTTSIASDTFADISGMTLSITPRATSSKILIKVNCYICGASTANQPINLLRDSTVLGTAAGADYTMPFRQGADAQNQYQMFLLSTTFLDSPSASSSTTYKLQWKTNSGTLYLNRAVNEGGMGSGVNACSTITAMEVAG